LVALLIGKVKTDSLFENVILCRSPRRTVRSG
jgi:hypothetical protein